MKQSDSYQTMLAASSELYIVSQSVCAEEQQLAWFAKAETGWPLVSLFHTKLYYL